jgi:MFS family permease
VEQASTEHTSHHPQSRRAPRTTMFGARHDWFYVAAAMFGVGWGANQFASMIVAYHQYLGLSMQTNEALLVIYVVGLAPALLLAGPASDRWGRSAMFRPAAIISVAATLFLIFGSHSVLMLGIGRFIAGVATGMVLASGTAWVKELSTPPFDDTASPQTGARRAAIALSAGFGLGPVVASILAQWGPSPLIVAYLPHLVVMALVLPGIWRAPETVHIAKDSGPGLFSRLKVPAASHPRFLAVVLPVAPWVFAAVTVALAVLPSIVNSRIHGLGVAFAGLVALVNLGTGILVQPIARRLDKVDDARGASLGLVIVVLGMLLAALAAQLVSPLLVLVTAVVLGAGYGFCLVAGLLEVQRLAGPDDLAGLNAMFYVLTYVGYCVPVVLAELDHFVSYPVLMLCLAGLAAVCLMVVTTASSRISTGQRQATRDVLQAR